MKKIPLLLLILIGMSGFAVGQSVTITGKKVTYKRPKPQMDFKKTFTINYPKVKAATPALGRKIEAALSYQKVLDLRLNEELRDVQWLEEADFDVKYNKNGALNVDLFMEGTAAYPDSVTRSVVVDTKTGMRVTPAMAFKNLPALVAMVRKTQRAEVAQGIIDIKKEQQPEDPDPKGLFEFTTFTAKNLDWFSIDATGVTFHYDYGFPHVIQAMQPAGEYRFTWAQLKPYLKAGGLLSRLAP